MKNSIIKIVNSIWFLRILLIALLLFGFSVGIMGEIRDPFNRRIQIETLNKVAEYMNVNLNPAILSPRIFKGSEITDEYNDSIWGFPVGDKRSNIFDYKNNVIILTNDAKIHNLAHELVHYIQYNYLGYKKDMEDGTAYLFHLEWEAFIIQNKFK